MAKATIYSEEVASTICERIAEGESLRAICEAEDMPNKSTVFRWLADNASFRDQYAHARESQADSLFDEILAIADTPQIGEKRKVKEDGGIEISTGDMIEHRRLQVDARKWMASKLQPKKYGDKIDVAHSGDMSVTFQTVYETKPE